MMDGSYSKHGQFMYTPIHAVALRTIKHNERSSILTAWSAELGRVSLLMPAGNGAESRRRRALTMSMALFEGVVDVRPGREIMAVKDLRPWSPAGVPADLTSSPARSTVAMFFAEVLTVVTREGSADEALWRLITETVDCLARSSGRGLANLVPAFLVRLAAVSGIEPDPTAYAKGYGLDMAEGVYRPTRPLHDYWINPADARLIEVFSRMTRRYAHRALIGFERAVRVAMLDGIIKYFTLHNYPLDRLRSLDVLRSL